MAEWVPDQFRLAGGLNEEDPQFTQAPGSLSFVRNYEVLPGGGYRRVQGYERYDGQAAPSSATYQSIKFIQGSGRPVVSGDTLTGHTSGATARVVGVTQVDTGSWALGDAAGYIGLTNISGTFQSGEMLRVGGVDAAKADSANTLQTVEDTSYKSWLAGARDYYRSLISPPAGTGPVRGVFVIGGAVYCFRLYSSSVRLFKATGTGWVQQTLTKYIRFDTGTAEILEGDTITGATSGAKAVVRRINIGSGNYTGPTYAKGRLAIDTIVGTFQAGENLQVGGVTKAISIEVVGNPTFTDGGRFVIIGHNFYGAANQRRVYGCDGVNRAWEFDGTYFTFIETGMTVDAPTFLDKHRNYLFLSFPGGSLQNSGAGLPLSWSPRLGAAEIGTGDDVTGLTSNGNNTLAITGQHTVHILQGTSNADWNLRMITNEIGSISYTMQEAGGNTIFLDRAGVNIVIPAPFTYQDLSTQAISRNVRKTVEANAANAVDSIHMPKKNHYRLFFNDKSVLNATYFGTKLMGWMKFQYAHQITCSNSGQIAGVDRVFFGTDDGYVMEMDVGTSFDGTAIESVLQLPYNYHRRPDRNKAFHKITLEVDTPRAIELRLATDFDYGGGGQSGQFLKDTTPTGGLWDVSVWEQFYWDSAVLSAPEINIDGVGANVGLTVYHNDAVDDSFTVSAVLLQFSILGIKR